MYSRIGSSTAGELNGMSKHPTQRVFNDTLNGALSLETVYRMLGEGKIPGAIQPGGKNGKWLIPEGALDQPQVFPESTHVDLEHLGASA